MPPKDHSWEMAILPFKSRATSFSAFTPSASLALSSHHSTSLDTMTDDRISKLLEDIRFLDSGRFDLVQALREIIFGLDASISEEVKYGGLLFSAGKPFCGVFSYAKHVSLEFGVGASLPDQFNVLDGKGKFRRHIKLSSLQDITDKHVHEYLVLALKASAAVEGAER